MATDLPLRPLESQRNHFHSQAYISRRRSLSVSAVTSGSDIQAFFAGWPAQASLAKPGCSRTARDDSSTTRRPPAAFAQSNWKRSLIAKQRLDQRLAREPSICCVIQNFRRVDVRAAVIRENGSNPKLEVGIPILKGVVCRFYPLLAGGASFPCPRIPRARPSPVPERGMPMYT